MNPVDLLELEYEILDEVRMGGLGTVYRARHRLLGEVRAIKIVTAVDEGFTRRLRSVFAIDHPKITAVHCHGIDDTGRGVLITDYMHGVDLGELVQRSGALSIGLALEIAGQALDSINFLHRSSIVHGHIVPASFMVGRGENDELSVKMVDFAAAHALGRTLSPTIERLRHEAPERTHKGTGHAAENAADLYSFSVVLYQLLTGRPFFVGDDPRAVLRSRLGDAHRGFDLTDPEGEIPEALRSLVLKGAAADHQRRPRSAQVLLEELEHFGQTFPLPGEAATLDLRPAPGSRTGIDGSEGLRAADDALPDNPLDELLGEVEHRKADDEDRAGHLSSGVVERDLGIVANALRVSARSMINRGDLAGAAAKLRKVHAMEPEDSEVRELLESTENALNEQRASRLRDAELRAVGAMIETRFDAGEIEQARTSLTLAHRVYGADPLLAELEERYAPGATHEIGHHLAAARRSLEASDHRATVSELREAGEHEPGAAEVRDMTRRTLQRHAEATVETYLNRGEEEDARVALSVGRKRFSSSLGLLAYDLEMTAGKPTSAQAEPKAARSRSAAGLKWLSRTRTRKTRRRAKRAKMSAGGRRRIKKYTPKHRAPRRSR